MHAGAVLTKQPKGTLATLQEIGEHLGIVFQIKDDELSLYGDEAETGKPVGSDVKEGKTTLFKHALYRRATEKERRAGSRIPQGLDQDRRGQLPKPGIHGLHLPEIVSPE